MTRNCAECGKQFEAQRRTAKYCRSSCRVRASQKRTAGQDKPAPPMSIEAPAPANLLDTLPLIAATRSELEAAGRLDTTLGQQAMRLAERMYSAMDTGSAIASLSRELRAVMGEALAGVPAKADSLDELSARRERKASGA